jgi:hypothetical protein
MLNANLTINPITIIEPAKSITVFFYRYFDINAKIWMKSRGNLDIMWWESWAADTKQQRSSCTSFILKFKYNERYTFDCSH